ncbi:diacylglycerol kinase (ATP) [Carnobacterium iners]|uniref:Diacylglycerol kinase (ATP) n=1 Tax=Carnobacterium iners TaxID=1073423 RepID=A0A1X7NGT8_9LACT|nr:diacylglycerol kinase family protein [Carnobacterium iners]SEK40098.1 diacylglycerol kinase (ATP) [Carnobacterium iners]SMH36564.1 diacylglycerol kinase (ATP) [Carnobacterium iners]
MPMDSKDNRGACKNSCFIDSFKYAFKGIQTVFQEERNMRTHLILGIITLFISWFLGIEKNEWLWIILSIFLVLVMEILNTIIENVVDLITENHYHPLAKKAKDMAAAAVLSTACFSIVTATIIFLPKIFILLT